MLTTEVRRDRMLVMDEVSAVLWYLEDRLMGAASATTERLADTFEATFGRPLRGLSPISAGSWVGGDRDGNPFVTPDITIAAARRVSHGVLRHYIAAVESLFKTLSLSARLAGVSDALRESSRHGH